MDQTVNKIWFLKKIRKNNLFIRHSYHRINMGPINLRLYAQIEKRPYRDRASPKVKGEVKVLRIRNHHQKNKYCHNEDKDTIDLKMLNLGLCRKADIMKKIRNLSLK
mgnify:FL=1